MAKEKGAKAPEKAAPAKKAAAKKGETKTASPALKMPDNQYQHVSVSVEKIDNGYLIKQSSSNKTGYSEHVTYSKTKPVVSIPTPRVGKGKRP